MKSAGGKRLRGQNSMIPNVRLTMMICQLGLLTACGSNSFTSGAGAAATQAAATASGTSVNGTTSSSATSSSGTTSSLSDDVTAGNLQLVAGAAFGPFIGPGLPQNFIVGIKEIDLHLAGGSFIPALTSVADTDLVSIQNANLLTLGQASIAAGTYDGIRVIYSKLSIVKSDGSTFTFVANGSDPTSAPSGTGATVNSPVNPVSNFLPMARMSFAFKNPITVSSSSVSHVLIDFDLMRFHLFDGSRRELPRFHIADLDSTGFLIGTVSPAAAASATAAAPSTAVSDPNPISANPLPVFVIATREGHFFGFALSDPSGNFSIPGLPAGTYNLEAYGMDGSFARVKGLVVTAEQETSAALGLQTPTPPAQ